MIATMNILLSLLLVAGGYALGTVLERRRRLSVSELRQAQGTDGEKIRSVIELRAAFHESGHAVCAWFHPHVSRIDRISIDDSTIGNGGVHYVVSSRHQVPIQGRDGSPSVELYRITTDTLWYSMVVNLGGIAGEMVQFGRMRSGPSTRDLLQAKANALAIVKARSTTPPWGETDLHDDSFDVSKMLRSIESGSEEAKVLNLAYHHAKHLLLKHNGLFEQVGVAILRRGVLELSDIDAIFGKRPLFFR